MTNKNKLAVSGVILVLSIAFFAGLFNYGYSRLSKTLLERKDVFNKFDGIFGALGNFPQLLEQADSQKQEIQSLIGQFNEDYYSNQDILSSYETRVLQTASANKLTIAKGELSKDASDNTIFTFETESSYEKLYKFLFDIEMFSEIRSINVSPEGVVKVVSSPIVYSNDIDDYMSGRKKNMEEIDSFGYFREIFEKTTTLLDSVKNSIPSQRDLLPTPRRNPFYFLEAKVVKVKKVYVPVMPAVNISGIMYDPVNPLVIIGGKIYKKGDYYKGARIVSIAEKTVTFLFDNKKYIIKISKGEGK